MTTDTMSTWPPLVAVDVEGNGTVPPDLVEVAVLPFTADGPVIGPGRAWVVRPPRPIARFATKVHGIGNDAVRDAPSWVGVAAEVRAALEGRWLVAHNAGVDYGVLTAHLPGWEPAGVLDTLRLARATWANVPGGYGLDNLTQYSRLDQAEIDGQRHRAGYDAHLAALLFQKLARQYEWPQLVAAAVPPGKPGTPTTIAPRTETLW